ncbi:hypothetical protein PG985_005699 [Apiospora marii]|uniref:uncharacterized protein n=1 Tax=Apiospora marii TaxID=335849 RepID=UPI0031301B9A
MAWRLIQRTAEIGYANAKAEGVKAGQKIAEGIKENPKVASVGGAVVAGAATGGLLMGPVLGAIGFSSIGPVAGVTDVDCVSGSMAAGIQSAGAAGALFSAFQSAAMGGYGVAAVLSFFIGAGAAVAGGAAAATAGTSSDDLQSPGENQVLERKVAHDEDKHEASEREEEK